MRDSNLASFLRPVVVKGNSFKTASSGQNLYRSVHGNNGWIETEVNPPSSRCSSQHLAVAMFEP